MEAETKRLEFLDAHRTLLDQLLKINSMLRKIWLESKISDFERFIAINRLTILDVADRVEFYEHGRVIGKLRRTVC